MPKTRAEGDRLATSAEVVALARFRRAQNVRIAWLAVRYGMRVGWVNEALRGLKPLTRSEVRTLRAHIANLAGEALVAAKAPKDPNGEP